VEPDPGGEPEDAEQADGGEAHAPAGGLGDGQDQNGGEEGADASAAGEDTVAEGPLAFGEGAGDDFEGAGPVGRFGDAEEDAEDGEAWQSRR
jgi:hypothetical protein